MDISVTVPGLSRSVKDSAEEEKERSRSSGRGTLDAYIDFPLNDSDIYRNIVITYMKRFLI